MESKQGSVKHIGFPLPSEMFTPPPKEREDWDKHVAITELLDIPLKCPHCEAVLKLSLIHI